MSKTVRKKIKLTLAAARRTGGALRELYFSEGGELCRWRGLSYVFTDRRKQKNKRACRGAGKAAD
jgi:hypothetical protein